MDTRKRATELEDTVDDTEGTVGHTLLTEQAPDAANRLRLLFASVQCHDEDAAAFEAFRQAINESRRGGRLLYP